MISDIDYMKLAMSQESDKTEIDPVLRSRAWSAVLVGLAMFWSIIALVVCNVWIISWAYIFWMAVCVIFMTAKS